MGKILCPCGESVHNADRDTATVFGGENDTDEHDQWVWGCRACGRICATLPDGKGTAVWYRPEFERRDERGRFWMPWETGFRD